MQPRSCSFESFDRCSSWDPAMLVHIVKLSLSSGFFPDSLKSAIVKPLLKKYTLNPDCFKNYRPVSNLSFLSKVIEKVLAVRLFDYMRNNDLLEPMQSAYSVIALRQPCLKFRTTSCLTLTKVGVFSWLCWTSWLLLTRWIMRSC